MERWNGEPRVRFYATIDADSDIPAVMPRDVAYMVPASSWWRKGFRPPRLPEGAEVAVDCGGYVNTKKHGTYPYGLWDYAAWVETVPGVTWAAMPDYCCEDDLTAEPGSATVCERQTWTTEHARTFTEYWGHEPFAWVPTVQGWTVDDYKRHAEQLAPLVDELQRWYAECANGDYAPGAFDGDDGEHEVGCACADCAAFARRARAGAAFRVGIGTLCRRKRGAAILEVVEAVSGVLGPHVPLHLWGVKLDGLQGTDLPSNVVSVDSAAWNGRIGPRGIAERTNEQRALGMTQREYGYKVALPRYLDKFEQRINGRRHSRLPAVRRQKWA